MKGVYMLTKQQIKLIQTAVKAAGIRTKNADGRYYFLLAQYRDPAGRPVKTCKDLNNMQLTDLLAICESYGWRMPGKADDHYRRMASERFGRASYAQLAAINYLRGDLGWGPQQLEGFLQRMTMHTGRVRQAVQLTSHEAYKVIEALKAIVGRAAGKQYGNLRDVQSDVEGARDGKGQATKVG